MSTPRFSRSRSPIRGQRRIAVVGGEVARRVHVRAPAAAHRDAQGVVDAAAAGPRRSGRAAAGSAARPRRPTSSPTGAAAWSGGSTPRPTRPSTRRGRRASAKSSYRRQRLRSSSSACRSPSARSALDVDAARDRVAHAVGLVRVLEAHARARGPLGDDVERDPDRPAVVGRPEPKSACSAARRARSSRTMAAEFPRHRQPVDALVGREGAREQRAPLGVRQRGGDGGGHGDHEGEKAHAVIMARPAALAHQRGDDARAEDQRDPGQASTPGRSSRSPRRPPSSRRSRSAAPPARS